IENCEGADACVAAIRRARCSVDSSSHEALPGRASMLGASVVSLLAFESAPSGTCPVQPSTTAHAMAAVDEHRLAQRCSLRSRTGFPRPPKCYLANLAGAAPP